MSNNPATAKRRAQNRAAQRNHRNNTKNRIASLEETNRALLAILLQNGLSYHQSAPNTSLVVNEEVQDLLTNETADVEQNALPGEKLSSDFNSANAQSTLTENDFALFSPSSMASWPAAEHLESNKFHESLVDWRLDSPADYSVVSDVLPARQSAVHVNAMQENVTGASDLTASDSRAGGMVLSGSEPLMKRKCDATLEHHETTSGNGQSTLALAIEHSHKEVVQLLIARGANPNGPDGKGRTPLHICAENGDSSMVGVLIEGGAVIDKPNREGMTPLQVASSKGALAVVDRLIEYGAKIY